MHAKKPGRILISVTDKSGLEKFKALTDLGWEIISTGGTADALKRAGVPYVLVEDITKFPEMMNGRVKTLHPNIFAGILAKRADSEHMEALVKHGIGSIEIVVVNLYAFGTNPGIDNIDIGGPSLLRAAAKNAATVTVVIDPKSYDGIIKSLIEDGETSLATRENLAMQVFSHTSLYDSAIREWMTLQPVGWSQGGKH